MGLSSEASLRIEEIEREMQEIGIWQSEPLPPEAMGFEAAFGADKLSFEQWIQFVFIPRMREIGSTDGEFPSSSNVGAQAARCFNVLPNGKRLIALLSELDAFIEQHAPPAPPGRDSLERAAAEGDVERVRELIEANTPISPTAFTWAVSEGTPEIVKLLLDAGADPNVRDSYGIPAVFFAAAAGHPALSAFLLDPKKTNIGAKQWNAKPPKVGHAEILWMLLDTGADPNQRFEPAPGQRSGDSTPLMVAAAFGHTGGIDVLLARGARPRARDALGRTALNWAEKSQSMAIMERLRPKTRRK
jgi:ankyrin repeat protein/uncharacterized protein YqcC (DUF446 family)